MDNMTDTSRLFSEAVYYGDISPDALAVLQKLGLGVLQKAGNEQKIKTHIDPPVIPIESPTVILAALLIDDSKSIQFHNNTQAVIDGHNSVIHALRGTRQRDDTLLRTQYMNGQVINDWVRLKDAQEINEANYSPDGSTPLFDASVVLLGTVFAEVQKVYQLGKQALVHILIVSDGKDHPSKTEPEECNASDVCVLVTDMLSHNTETFMPYTIAFMDIDDGETDYEEVAHAMGIGLDGDAKWIITPYDFSKRMLRAFGWSSQTIPHDLKQAIKQERPIKPIKQWRTESIIFSVPGDDT